MHELWLLEVNGGLLTEINGGFGTTEPPRNSHGTMIEGPSRRRPESLRMASVTSGAWQSLSSGAS